MPTDDLSEETLRKMEAHRKELDRRSTRKVRTQYIFDEAGKIMGKTDASIEATKEWLGDRHV